MRILHLSKHGVRGNGSVHVAVDLACEQARLGHEVYFVSGPGSFEDVLSAAGVTVIVIAEARSVRSALAALAQLDAAVRRTRPHIVHAHMMSAAILGRVVTGLRGRALVTTVHNSFDAHSWIMRLGDRIVAVSAAEEAALLQRGFAAGRLRVVLNGIIGTRRDTDPAEPAPELTSPAIVTLCGLHPRKAVDDAIRGFAMVEGADEWTLNVVGWGTERPALEALAADLGIGDRVRFHGPTRAAQQVLRAADVFVTTSLADPCPLAVMEARAARCAVVGTDVGGIPEILDHGAAGQLVPVRDPRALAAVLQRLVGTEGEVDRWKDRAERGSEYFSVARMTADHLPVYREAIRTAPLGRLVGLRQRFRAA